MELVGFWRARRALLWYLGIMLAVVAFVAVVGGHATIDVSSGDAPPSTLHMRASLSTLIGIAMFFCAIFASRLGTSLNTENATVELSWTRPIPRAVLAARFIAIDLITLELTFVLTIAGACAVVAGAHGSVVIDPLAGNVGLLAAGVLAMWYAVTLLATAGLRRRGGGTAGLLWPASLVLIGLGEARQAGIIHQLALVVNVVNPLAYLSSMVRISSAAGPMPSVWPLDPSVRTVIVWAFAAVFCTAAVAIWQRREI
jgi:hypothetical protein